MGPIPAHWSVNCLKRIATFCGGGTPSKANLDYWRGEIPWVSPKDMKSEVVSDSQDHISEKALADTAVRLVDAGSVLVVVRSGILKHSVPVAINSCSVALNQDMKAIIPDAFLTPSYLASLIRSHQSALLVEWRKAGATVESIEHDLLAGTQIPVPPPPEQRAIAAFLDQETQKIDRLVAKRERLIELLEEKRTALISRAVSKGLDPDVPMKDSGVEWLGKIPEHWTLIALRRLLANIEQGWSPNAEDRVASLDEWGVIKISAIDEGFFRSEEVKALPQDVVPDSRYEIQAGDILLTRGNTPNLVGDVCIVGNTRPRLMLSDLVYRLSVEHQKVDRVYLTYWLLSRAGRYQITRDARGSSQSMVKISQEHIRSWSVALPPLAEQQAIVAFVERETSKLDALVGKVREHIDMLREYRTALISAAVTGKIDVRAEVPDSKGKR
ncbi:MAG: hypothetical protein CYG60_03555 [Actinobacteria bacterium]|nr:MAG: hypothetical protein CYG60_03555 [Actinomycetota bacterium]